MAGKGKPKPPAAGTKKPAFPGAAAAFAKKAGGGKPPKKGGK